MPRRSVGAANSTREMRGRLATASVELPADEQLTALSRSFNGWLGDLSWYKVFKEMDEDDSRFLTYDELATIVRGKLRKGPRILSDDALQALWCVLDADNSDRVTQDEMAGFLRRGAVATKQPKAKEPKHVSTRPSGPVPTKQLRGELAADSVGLPNIDELKRLASDFNTWLEAARRDQGKGKATSVFSLFKEVDEDGSGFITYDEMTKVVRQKLHVKMAMLPETTLKVSS